MATFAQDHVQRLEALLAKNVGVKTVTVGNTTVTYDDLLKQYDYCRERLVREHPQSPNLRWARVLLSVHSNGMPRQVASMLISPKVIGPPDWNRPKAS